MSNIAYPSDASRSWANPFGLGFAVIVVVAIALRWHGIDDRSLWYDELVTASASTGSLAETVKETGRLSSAPVLHPVILQFVERFSQTPAAVRLPSAIAGVLAVLVLALCAKQTMGMRAGILAGCILTFSATQIRYSQEVREYSLSVLGASLLIMFFLKAVERNSSRRSNQALWVLLFLAPLIQYGLAVFAASIVAVMFTVALAQDGFRGAFMRTLGPGLALAGGTIATVLLTFRNQLYLVGMQEDRGFYFDPQRDGNVLLFISERTNDLLSFVYLGPTMVGIAVLALMFHSWISISERKWDPILWLTVMSVGIAIVASLLRLYPYGAMRQCIYLSPMLILAAVSAIETLGRNLAANRQALFASVLVSTFVILGVLDIKNRHPYAEKQDIKAVLRELRKSATPADEVYVYYESIFAIRYYAYDHPNLLIGDDRNTPERFATDVLSLSRGAPRIWLIFSHIQPGEDTAILSGLAQGWTVDRVVDAVGAALYLAVRNDASVTDGRDSESGELGEEESAGGHVP